MPPVAEIEKKLRSVLTPALFAPGRMPGHWKLRNRLLTLPAMTAIVVSLVGRQIPSLREVLRVLAAEGLLWQPVLKVSCQALSKRLARFLDAFTAGGKFFLSRLRGKTRYQVVAQLSNGPRYRDQLIRVGAGWGHVCTHPLRLVSILWNQTWYQYLTNVLDPETLSARQVGELYRRRWRIEEAFLLTKRLLGLSYLWVGGGNGVQIQIYATWIFYAVLINVCRQLAGALGQPQDRISVEMVYRSFYHFSRASEKDPSLRLIPYLTAHAKLFSLVKAITKRQRLIQQQLEVLWMPP